ncbi:MAG: helix-turn-helix transcriptional regulator [Rhodocyclales bacterium]|nr:helix-turn-helix transcriptional regulator [Rhodocyclales bacterium]
MSQKNIKGLSLVCHWSTGERPSQPEEARLLGLLERIRLGGSIAAAAREAGISYRNAWGLLARWEARFGHPLLIPARGLGTRLTPFAARLLELDVQIRDLLAPHLAAAAEQMAQGLAEAVAPARAVPRIHASHDLALALLPARMAKLGQPADLQFHGSLESLASFAEGRCEIAGFHCPEGAVGATLWQQYKPYLRPRQQALIRLAKRTQGIMVAPGNPKKLRGIRDLTRPGVRFLNRQSGAGTRLLLDWMLRENGIAARTIAGYGDVELTHSAVAAMIASGHADAGLGVEAAARQFDLGFVPLLKEDYFLVTRRELLRQPAFVALVELLKGNAFRGAVRALSGYDPAGSGMEEPFYGD